MRTARYVRWQDGEMWLGYFEEFPDYLTQAESLSELEENLRDIYQDRNPVTGVSQSVPRHREIKEFLALHIFKNLNTSDRSNLIVSPLCRKDGLDR